MTGRFSLLLIALGGCVTTPPLSHLQSMAANTALDQPTTELGIAASTDVVGSAGHAIPLEGAKGVVLDLSGEAGLAHGAITPGIWLRSGGQERNQVHFGWRIGAAGGLGDMGNYEPWRRPWAGPSTHLQLSTAWGQRGAWALTLGGEYTMPLLADPPGVDVAMIPALWISADTRFELELNESNALFFGVGVAVDWVLPIPNIGIGGRF